MISSENTSYGRSKVLVFLLQSLAVVGQALPQAVVLGLEVSVGMMGEEAGVREEGGGRVRREEEEGGGEGG